MPPMNVPQMPRIWRCWATERDAGGKRPILVDDL
jgi:hypothetical protein